MLKLPISALTIRDLGSCHFHPYNKKKLDKLKKINISHRRPKVTGQTIILKFGEMGACRFCQPISAYLEQKLLKQ